MDENKVYTPGEIFEIIKETKIQMENSSEKIADKNLSFSKAIEAVEKNLKVTREGWTEKDTWIKLLTQRTLGIPLDGDEIGSMLSYIAIKLPGGSKKWGEDAIDLVPYTPSQLDMLAKDWKIVY